MDDSGTFLLRFGVTNPRPGARRMKDGGVRRRNEAALATLRAITCSLNWTWTGDWGERGCQGGRFKLRSQFPLLYNIEKGSGSFYLTQYERRLISSTPFLSWRLTVPLFQEKQRVVYYVLRHIFCHGEGIVQLSKTQMK